MRSDSLGKLEEYSNITMALAGRFRWPLGPDRRMVPYLTAGVGYSINDDNDQHKPKVKLHADDSTFAGTVGAGLEYFLNPNVAIGFGGLFYIYPDQDVSIVQRAREPDHSRRERALQPVVVLDAGARAALPRPARRAGKPGPPEAAVRRPRPLRHGRAALLSLRARRPHGAVRPELRRERRPRRPGRLQRDARRQRRREPRQALGGGDQFFDVAPNINGDPFGKFSEVDNLTFLLLGRYRWQFLGGRLVAFATAGIGAGTYDLNDSRTFGDIPLENGGAVVGQPPKLTLQSTSVAGTVGVGVEYFLNHHISFGLSLPAYLYPDLDTTVTKPNGNETRGHANFSGLAPQIQVKAYLN